VVVSDLYKVGHSLRQHMHWHVVASGGGDEDGGSSSGGCDDW